MSLQDPDGRVRVRIGLNQQLRLRQIHHQQPFGVRLVLHQIDLERLIAVRDHPLVLHELQHRRARHPREAIRAERVRVLEDLLLVVLLVRFVRDDRNAFRRVRAYAARVVRVMMRVDDVLDRLARRQPLRRRH